MNCWWGFTINGRVAMLDTNHPVERLTRTLVRSKFTVLSSTQMNQWEGQVPACMQCLNHWYYPKPEWNLYEPSSPTFSYTLVEKQIIWGSLHCKPSCSNFRNFVYFLTIVLLFRICLALILLENLLEYSSIYTKNWKKKSRVSEYPAKILLE